MERWSLAAELLAFILIIMTAMFYYDKRQVKSVRRRIFEAGLWLAGASVVLNALCVYTIEYYEKIPHWINIILNSAYFATAVGMPTVVAAYLFDLLLEHVYNKECRRRANVGLSVLSGLYAVILVLNPWTKWLFWFDAKGGYHRGVLNQSGYGIMMIELIMIGMCYHRNRASVSRKVKKVIYTLPSIVILLAAFQLAFPEILLNGTIMTFALLIIFVNFQNSKVGRDDLTGAGNRKSFYEELHLRLSGKQQFQVVLVSLNRFAMVNQKFGYRKGDEFLYHIVRWMEELRRDGRVFRFANVTFALLCPYVDEADSERLLAQIQERFDRCWILGDVRYKIRACFGTMVCKEFRWEATQIVELLTFIMETAKKKEDGIVKFDSTIETMFQKEKQMERLLLDSIKKERFEVWYQPIYNCKEKKFDVAEALIRLRDYDGNMVSPADFIPLAEKNGMIEDIGWFVWNEVCRFLGAHPELPLQGISVNMSIQQFLNPKLCEKMEKCLESAQVSVDKVRLEITERVILYDEKHMKHLMEHFLERGFQFFADDFGTGYSNFSSIMHLPFMLVKFDRSLIEKISFNTKDKLVIESMMELFHNIGLKIVAEGVETAEQEQIIKSIGADYIQGFYYAKPMPKEELVVFLEER